MSGGFLESVNPSTGELLERVPVTPPAEVESRIARAERTFQDWRRTRFADRSELLRRVAGILRDRRDRLARLMAVEMGKPLQQGRAEVDKCARACEHYAETGEELLSDLPVRMEGGRTFVRFEPLGPLLAIMPWNFPLWQVFRFAAPALLAGNVALLKHASNVPRCTRELDSLFSEAGFPRGAFQVLLLPSSDIAPVVRDPRVRGISLTGSDVAGAEVASVAGAALKKVVLELGGSDPFIVLKDADVERAAKVAAGARTVNSGESCIAAKRFLVDAAVAKPFLDAFRAEMGKLRVADPLEEGCDVGPLARPDLVDTLHRQVERSVAMGARLELGGSRLPGPGNFYPPTVLSKVAPGMPVFDEETFGPVAAVSEVTGAEEALRLANLSPFGLGASVWTRDAGSALAIAQELENGMVFVNGMVQSDPALPFGGVKRSGHGRELGPLGIREFVNAKTIRFAL